MMNHNPIYRFVGNDYTFVGMIHTKGDGNLDSLLKQPSIRKKKNKQVDYPFS